MSNEERKQTIENRRARIDMLIQTGKIKGVMGNPQDNDSFSFTTWTRKLPSDYLLSYIEVSHHINPSGKLLVLVDDVLSMAVFDRSKHEQEVYNSAYRKAFESTQKARVLFTSATLSEMNYSELLVINGRKVSLNHFVAMLPELKRKKITSLNLNEVIHALQNLIFLDFLAQQSNTILAGEGTMAMIASHRNISKSPLSAIFLPMYKQA